MVLRFAIQKWNQYPKVWRAGQGDAIQENQAQLRTHQ